MNDDNPSWLEIHRNENRAFISLRTTSDSIIDWGLFTAEAQYVIGSSRQLSENDQLLDYSAAQNLIAASRVLDCASQASANRHDEVFDELDPHVENTTEDDVQFSEAASNEDFSLCLLAAVANAMHGNFCSASAIINRNPPDPSRMSAAENAIVAICSPQSVGDALDGLRKIISRENQQAALSGDVHVPSPASNVLKFLESFEFMLRTGEETVCSTILELHKRCLSPDWTSFEMALWGGCRVCIEHAIKLSVARNLRNSNIAFPSEYIDNLTRFGKRVFFPPQLRALQKGLLESSNENCLVTLPTSAGKTFVSELLLVASLVSSKSLDSKTARFGCYIVPYIALGNQVANVLERHLAGTGIAVYKIFGDYPWPGDRIHTSAKAIIVATPERLDSILRNHGDLINNIQCVVCDEAHSIETGVRGVRLEGILTRLRLRQAANQSTSPSVPPKDQHLRLILVSAVISHPDSVLSWLDANNKALEIRDDWKPTAKRFAIWTEDGKLTWYIGKETVGSRGLPADTPLGTVRIPWPERGLGYAKYQNAARPQLAKAFINVSYLVDYLKTTFSKQPILCVCATKDSTRALALEISNRLPTLTEYAESTARAIQLIETQHTFLRPLAQCLRHGVAFHNASLPFELRSLIEKGVQNREITVVTSTTTLAEGVDLPFRLTVLVDWNFYRDGLLAPMSPGLFQNILGRCGRAGIYTEGDTIVFDNPIGDSHASNPYTRAQTQRNIFFNTKSFFVHSAIAKSMSDTPDIEMKACLESQLLAAIQENTHLDDIERAFTASSFAAQVGRLTNPSITNSYIEQQLHSITDSLLGNDQGQVAFAARNSPLVLTALGRAVNTTAFSPSSCRRIIKWLSTMDNSRADDAEFLAKTLRVLGDLPEQPISKFRTIILEANPKRGFRYCIRSNHITQIISDWLANTPAETIFSKLPLVQNSSRKGPSIDEWLAGTTAPSWDREFDKFAEFTQSVLRGFLPWLLRACKTLVDHIPSYSGDIDWDDLAMKVEHPNRQNN